MSETLVTRLVRLLHLLHKGRYFDTRELSEQLGVSRRTIFRDLRRLENDCDIEVEYSLERKGYAVLPRLAHFQKLGAYSEFTRRTIGQRWQVCVRFNDHQQIAELPTDWHDNQTITRGKSNEILWNAETDNLGGVVWWVLAFNGHAEVLEPVILRDEVCRQLPKFLKRSGNTHKANSS